MSTAPSITHARREATTSQHYARKASGMGIAEAIALHSNPAPDKGPRLHSSNRRSYSRRTRTALRSPNRSDSPISRRARKSGYDVRILDCPGADPDRITLSEDGCFRVQGLDVEAALDHIDPRSDIIGLTIMFSQEWPFVP